MRPANTVKDKRSAKRKTADAPIDPYISFLNATSLIFKIFYLVFFSMDMSLAINRARITETVISNAPITISAGLVVDTQCIMGLPHTPTITVGISIITRPSIA
jgi:hypothetical protein